MKPARCSSRLPGHIDSRLRPVRTAGGHLPAWQAHSSPYALQLSARHPQIAQCKQRHEVRRVLGQSFVAHLDEAKLALDDSKRVLHLGPNTGLELFCFVQQGSQLGFLSSARRLPGRIATCPSTPVASGRFVAPW